MVLLQFIKYYHYTFEILTNYLSQGISICIKRNCYANKSIQKDISKSNIIQHYQTQNKPLGKVVSK